MVVHHNGKMYSINVMSIALHIVAAMCIIASFFDGWAGLIVGMLILIFDSIRFPFDNIMEVFPLEKDVDDADDLDID